MRRTLAWADETGTPVVTRGAGSGRAAAAVGVAGAVVLDVSGIDRILEIDPVEQLARVEPGVITASLDAAAAAHGLMYAPDPGSVGISTIGGNIATNAGGLRGAKYGVTRDHVLALDVVLADGSLVRVGRETLRGVTGYDLVGLFTGSDGTLGVVVGATLRLVPRPVRTATATAFLPAAAIAGTGARPAVLEIIDGPTLEAIDALDGSALATRGGACLVVQTDGFGADEERVDVYVFGRAGDGNLHPIIVTPPAEPSDPMPAEAQAAADRIFALAIELGGTITAEHGVGRLKRAWAERELGPEVHALQTRIRALLDPRGILNPGSSV